MPVESLDLAQPWPFMAFMATAFLICLFVALRGPWRVKPLIGCVAIGGGLLNSLGDNLRLDNEGVTQTGLIHVRTIVWTDVADARFVERPGKRRARQTLVFVGRNGDEIQLGGADSLGRKNAAIVAQFLRDRLPGSLGYSVSARLIPIQRAETGGDYRLAVTPGA